MKIRLWHGAILAIAVSPPIAEAGFVGVDTAGPPGAASLRLLDRRPHDVRLDLEPEVSATFPDHDAQAAGPAVAPGETGAEYEHVAIDLLCADLTWDVQPAALLAAGAPGAAGRALAFPEASEAIDVAAQFCGPGNAAISLIGLRDPVSLR